MSTTWKIIAVRNPDSRLEKSKKDIESFIERKTKALRQKRTRTLERVKVSDSVPKSSRFVHDPEVKPSRRSTLEKITKAVRKVAEEKGRLERGGGNPKEGHHPK